jgi:hypothetical protein
MRPENLLAILTRSPSTRPFTWIRPSGQAAAPLYPRTVTTAIAANGLRNATTRTRVRDPLTLLGASGEGGVSSSGGRVPLPFSRICSGEGASFKESLMIRPPGPGFASWKLQAGASTPEAVAKALQPESGTARVTAVSHPIRRS